uniref:Uncharacterized protein n=1 Tax=Globisporangium ultimum (strain ATCC 200006 / CBS 805.95 / DAOM BR144) TaxID=431595 RepID=K3WEL1_GLOUD
MASSDDDETAVHGAATAADTASTDGASPADALATASAAATAPSADHPTSTAIGMFFGMDGVVGGDAEDAINIIEDGDHVSAEDFGLSSTEISMNAMATASESMAAHMNLNMELNALQIQAFLARAENEPSSSNNSSAALLPVAGATDATAQATPAPVQESRQDDHAPAEPSHAAASPAPPPPPPTEDSRPQNAYEASRGVVFYSRREDKIKQIREHPIVASVSQDGRQIACKCGRNVRLNPPWYILKFEQHIVSRNCTFLRKKTKKSSNTTEPSTSIDSERMDQQGRSNK